MSRDKAGKALYSATVIPNRGAWLEYETDSNDVFYVRIDKNRKLPVTTFIRALGLSSDAQILDFFGSDTKMLATLEKDSIILLFSYSGATTNGLQVLELAKTRGIKTILITRFPKSPAAKLADVVLRCGSNEGPFQLGSVAAKIAQLVVVDILFQEYYSRNRESCEENIQSIASALSDLHL
jgi:DNA-binding MurR/RpiR family transcriptional regulator